MYMYMYMYLDKKKKGKAVTKDEQNNALVEAIARRTGGTDCEEEEEEKNT